ncbi:hypothetical protein N7495_007317 [Penicillium taxi]|uniref:uncharacterized protein n=1 Tax=Penicillium taxi TaxID=168475 RepID=UPI002544E8A2|nr:uncharacterized protein N7495_007317 [Penicillium taxi]KAJ5895626.1 hypothetical protein N7495_007317 [Penicillium taxi]
MPSEFITIRTLLPTIPIPPNSARPAITTSRLLLRALETTDLEALYTLRTQEEVMVWTSTGHIDKNIEDTKGKLEFFLPPNDATTANCAICWKETGEFIGIGGCHLYVGSHGWPELGYMLRKEVWGHGLATEFLSAWLRFWSGLPRSEQEITVHKSTVRSGVQEQITAVTDSRNAPSQHVLLKSSFEKFREYTKADGNESDGLIRLVAFRYFPLKET